MADIIFINPPYETIAPGKEYVKHIINRSPSLGILFLAAKVREGGFEPKILECDLQDYSNEEVAQIILEEKPKFIGFTLFTVGVLNSVEIAKMVRAQNPNIHIIVGGPHISSMGIETLTKFDIFDVGVVFEGELIINDLLHALADKTPLADVQGIVYRDEKGNIRATQAPEQIKELDKLPMPAWDLLPNFPDAYLPAIFDYPRAPVASYSASRGCPFKCEFCDTSTFGAKVRYNSPKYVYKTMKYLSDTYGIKHLQFVDDLFVANRKIVSELCDLLVENPIDMTWSCTARVDTVKPEVLAKMKAAKCWEISYGIESGSDVMLKAMRKSIKSKQSEDAIRWTNEAGINVKGLFMLGYPGETRETIAETKEFVSKLTLTKMNLSKFTPYPGSPIYKKLYNTSIRDEDWERLNGMNFVYTADGFTEDELEEKYQEVIGSFYQRKAIMFHYTKMAMANPTHLIRLMKMGIGVLKTKVGLKAF